MAKKTTKTTKTKSRLNAALTDLFIKVETDQNNLEDLIAKGSAAVAAFNGSTEALLRGILNPPENWQFPADSNPYEAVKKAVANRAADKGEKVTLPEGSIAGGRWRALARDSEEPLTRLAGRLAGRLSTLMSKGKESSTKTKGKISGKGEKGDKYARGFDDGFMLGRADLVLDLLDAFPKDKAIASFIKEQKIPAKVLGEARERRASAAASAAAKNAA